MFSQTDILCRKHNRIQVWL